MPLFQLRGTPVSLLRHQTPVRSLCTGSFLSSVSSEGLLPPSCNLPVCETPVTLGTLSGTAQASLISGFFSAAGPAAQLSYLQLSLANSRELAGPQNKPGVSEPAASRL